MALVSLLALRVRVARWLTKHATPTRDLDARCPALDCMRFAGHVGPHVADNGQTWEARNRAKLG